ncbi:uncharacterized protein BDW47DRAFT_10121 [Aspergillus candidus]|uniref:Uncharacterized protein n=1 Tax=Aspergillus candidus TaxID=41067 RepID=A0A2I2EXM5_ASPCN|nr:hypothetical protein BDW47DRAFT_10121 [Aspergillus candidus]PLB33129.1 hypothetical protein BDW47DRAFT_10121 [Aspergillus candidus]
MLHSCPMFIPGIIYFQVRFLPSPSYNSHLSPLEGCGDDTVLLSLILVDSAFRSFCNFVSGLIFPFLFFSFPCYSSYSAPDDV